MLLDDCELDISTQSLGELTSIAVAILAQKKDLHPLLLEPPSASLRRNRGRWGQGLITRQHTQEGLSLAYIHALSAQAGVNLSAHRVHDYGVDGTFRAVKVLGKRRVESGVSVDFQLKATTNWQHDSARVIYDLEAKTYNDLVQRETAATSCILILLCLPSNDLDWLHADEERLILKNCCYWAHVKGAPTNNVSTTRISIPRANTLTSATIVSILQAERARLVKGV